MHRYTHTQQTHTHYHVLLHSPTKWLRLESYRHFNWNAFASNSVTFSSFHRDLVGRFCRNVNMSWNSIFWRESLYDRSKALLTYTLKIPNWSPSAMNVSKSRVANDRENSRSKKQLIHLNANCSKRTFCESKCFAKLGSSLRITPFKRNNERWTPGWPLFVVTCVCVCVYQYINIRELERERESTTRHTA